MPPLSPIFQASGPRLRARRRRIILRRLLAAMALAGVAVAVVLVVRALQTNEHGARVEHFTVASRSVHASLRQAVVIPPGSDGRGRPLLVFLHGKGENEDTSLDAAMFAALAAQGTRAPDVVFANGGADSYWHNRRSGAWATYVLREVIPQALALTHADPRRLAIGGISMGGFGALDIARSHRGRFCAVGGHSAALWARSADTAAGAFDDARDFARHDLIALAGRENPYGQTPVWLDAGQSDPFHAADSRFAAELRRHHARVQFTTAPGGHDTSYWDARWTQYLRFYAGALARCRG